MAEVQKVSGSITGLRLCKEATRGTIPATVGSQEWFEMEPNSYADFGGELVLLSRSPINPSRQRKKGVVTDLNAAGGFNQDVTFWNMRDVWESLFFAKRHSLHEVKEPTIAVSSNTSTVTLASHGIVVGDIVLGEDFVGAEANNGEKLVTAAATNTFTYAGGATVSSKIVGSQFRRIGHNWDGSGRLAIAATSGSLPELVKSVGADLNSFGLRKGDWVYLNGFTAKENNGFCRIAEDPTATKLIFDKTGGGTTSSLGTAGGTTEMKTEAAAADRNIYFGDAIKNVSALTDQFLSQSWTVERTLGKSVTDTGAATQSEELIGAFFNEFNMQIPQADKVAADVTLVASKHQVFNGKNAAGSQSRPNGARSLRSGVKTPKKPKTAPAFNTSLDVARMKMAIVRPTQDGRANRAAPTPLFGYITEMNLNINNNMTPDKAVGVLGAFDVSAGEFQVGGSITAYFSTVDAIEAITENEDVTLDVILGVKAQGVDRVMLWDMPLIALGNGRLNVTQGEAITIPLENSAAEYEPFGHTFLLMEFPFLPSDWRDFV